MRLDAEVDVFGSEGEFGWWMAWIDRPMEAVPAGWEARNERLRLRNVLRGLMIGVEGISGCAGMSSSSTRS